MIARQEMIVACLACIQTYFQWQVLAPKFGWVIALKTEGHRSHLDSTADTHQSIPKAHKHQHTCSTKHVMLQTTLPCFMRCSSLFPLAVFFHWQIKKTRNVLTRGYWCGISTMCEIKFWIKNDPNALICSEWQSTLHQLHGMKLKILRWKILSFKSITYQLKPKVT